MSFDLLVKNGTVVFPDRAPARLDVAIRDGRFAALLEPGRTSRPRKSWTRRASTSSPA